MIAGAPGRPAGATGRAIAAGGTGLLVGPVLAGLLADRVGTWAPFAAGAALALPVTIFFALQRSGPRRAPGARAAAPAARGAHRNRMVVYAMLATVLLGFVGGMGNLLGSLRLSENGLSPSGIGVLFSIGALVWIVVAPLAGRMGEQRSHVALTACGCALLGAAWLVPWPTARRSRSPPSSWPRAAGPRGTQHVQLPARRHGRAVGRRRPRRRDRPRQPELGRRGRDRPAGRERSARQHRRAHPVRRHRRALPAVAALMVTGSRPPAAT